MKHLKKFKLFEGLFDDLPMGRLTFYNVLCEDIVDYFMSDEFYEEYVEPEILEIESYMLYHMELHFNVLFNQESEYAHL